MIHRFTIIMTALVFSLPAAAAELPEAVRSDETVVLKVHAEGAQIYQCKANADGQNAWQFREPIAALFDGEKTFGRHFAGPSWEAADGSLVTGKLVGKAAGATPKDIPWLKLEVASHKGEGALSTVTTIQRIETHGGDFAGPCSEKGALHAEPYAADYVFLRK